MSVTELAVSGFLFERGFIWSHDFVWEARTGGGFADWLAYLRVVDGGLSGLGPERGLGFGVSLCDPVALELLVGWLGRCVEALELERLSPLGTLRVRWPDGCVIPPRSVVWETV